MNHKRKKSKRNVKCTMCTTHRWAGNSDQRFKPKDSEAKRRQKDEIDEAQRRSK